MTDLEEAFRTALKQIDEVRIAPIDAGAVSFRARRRTRRGWLAAIGVAASLLAGTVLVTGRLPIVAPVVQAGPAAGAATSFADQPPEPVSGSGASVESQDASPRPRPTVGTGVSASQTDVIAAARALPDAPQAVRDRSGRVSCGSYVLSKGESVPDGAVKCLASGSGRELDVSGLTTEGDPVPVFYIVEAQGTTIDAYSSLHADRFGGGQTWTHEQCPLSAATSWKSLVRCS